MQINRDRNRRKKSGFLQGLLILAVVGGASLSLAFVWQNAQNSNIQAPLSVSDVKPIVSEDIPKAADPAESSNIDNMANEPEIHAVNLNESSEESSSEPSDSNESSSETESSSEESSSASTASDSRPQSPDAVPETVKVENSYFADAIFFGDSLSTGIPLYQVAGNPDTVAFTGINPDSINTSAVIPTPEGKKTVLDAAKKYGDKKKVYIMLGANGLWMDEATFSKGYQTFITSVKEQYPKATIYLQSILPVTHDAYKTYETANNEVITALNKQIVELCKKNGVYYLDIANALMDEMGALPKEASPMDGMHLTPEYYNKWFEYLKTHTVEGKRK